MLRFDSKVIVIGPNIDTKVEVSETVFELESKQYENETLLLLTNRFRNLFIPI